MTHSFLNSFARINPKRVLKKFSLGTELDSETTGGGFHILKNWLVHQTLPLISLVNNNHMANNLKEILLYYYENMPI